MEGAEQTSCPTTLCYVTHTRFHMGPSEKWGPVHRTHEQSPPVLFRRASPTLQQCTITAKSSRLPKKQSADPSSHPCRHIDHISYLGGYGKSCCLRSLSCSLTRLSTIHPGAPSKPWIAGIQRPTWNPSNLTDRQVIWRHTLAVFTAVSVAKTRSFHLPTLPILALIQ